MAKVLTDNKHYTDIANAIREKNGTEDTYKPSEMAAAITAIVSGGGGDLPEEAFLVTGNCQYRFAYGGWDWFIEKYGNQVTTKDITNATSMFASSKVTHIPFDINFPVNTSVNNQTMFQNCTKLVELPKITNCTTNTLENIFYGCSCLRYLPEDIVTYFDWSRMDGTTTTYQGSRSGQFQNCSSLRSVPMDFLNHANPVAYYSYTYFNNGFKSCYALDELVDLPLPYRGDMTSNIFNSTVTSCYRLKNFTFAMPDGQPYVVNWKSQIIDLTTFVGRAYSEWEIIQNNSGITEDKWVKDDETYQALKDDPDWFTHIEAYSRYNHDSAVATINSLPDTSAYLATAGGTNTIKFKGEAGSATDGGAINTLTEEEIAVATAKGWTVTLV